MDTSKLPALVFLQGGTIQAHVQSDVKICKRSKFYKLLSCYLTPDGIPEQFDGNLNIGSDISDWIRREVTADEIEVNLENFIL